MRTPHKSASMTFQKASPTRLFYRSSRPEGFHILKSLRARIQHLGPNSAAHMSLDPWLRGCTLRPWHPGHDGSRRPGCHRPDHGRRGRPCRNPCRDHPGPRLLSRAHGHMCSCDIEGIDCHGICRPCTAPNKDVYRTRGRQVASLPAVLCAS